MASKKYHEAQGKKYKKLTDWARQIIGDRQLTLKQRLADSTTKWQQVLIDQWLYCVPI